MWPLHQLWYMISGGKWDFFGGLICSSDPLPTGGSVGPTQTGDGALILNGNTSAAVWTRWEATSCHGAEKPPQQTPWTGEQGYQCCSAEECRCCASQSHCCWCILQRGLCLTVLMCSATEWWYIKHSLSLACSLTLSQVSQISSVFDCLLEEEERTLKENPVDSVQWAEVVLTVNNIIKVEGLLTIGLLTMRRLLWWTTALIASNFFLCRMFFKLLYSTGKSRRPFTDLQKMLPQSPSTSHGQVTLTHPSLINILLLGMNGTDLESVVFCEYQLPLDAYYLVCSLFWSWFLQPQGVLAGSELSFSASMSSSFVLCTHMLILSFAALCVNNWWHCWTSTSVAMWRSSPPCSSNKNATTAWRWSTASGALSCWPRFVSVFKSKDWRKEAFSFERCCFILFSQWIWVSISGLQRWLRNTVTLTSLFRCVNKPTTRAACSTIWPSLQTR